LGLFVGDSLKAHGLLGHKQLPQQLISEVFDFERVVEQTAEEEQRYLHLHEVDVGLELEQV
jgi:hypothetical protein